MPGLRPVRPPAVAQASFVSRSITRLSQLPNAHFFCSEYSSRHEYGGSRGALSWPAANGP
jgi:hypothetical protein